VNKPIDNRESDNPDDINLHGILSLSTITVVKNALNSQSGSFRTNEASFLKL